MVEKMPERRCHLIESGRKCDEPATHVKLAGGGRLRAFGYRCTPHAAKERGDDVEVFALDGAPGAPATFWKWDTEADDE